MRAEGTDGPSLLYISRLFSRKEVLSVITEKISDDDIFWFGIKMLQIEYLQSIGVKYDKKLDELMKEVYNL